MTLDELNKLPDEEFSHEMTRCCGSRRWTRELAAHRPFDTEGGLRELADRTWNGLGPEDWKEAFSHHPKIGDVESLRKKFASTVNWAAGEQSGAQDASEETLQQLAQGNEQYLEKFGYIFIVCAAGKTAGEMLLILKARLPNDDGVELKIAAQEQNKITKIRLGKLLS